MKRIYNFLALAIVAMLTLSLTSCEDERIADALDGIWEGQVSTNSDYTKYQYVDMESSRVLTDMPGARAWSTTTTGGAATLTAGSATR